jgi:parallel beta-helix repeat protein
MLREEERVMSKRQWYAKSSYLLVALALVLSLGLVAVPMAGTVDAVVPVGTNYYVSTTGSNGNSGTSWLDAWKTITYAVETGATTPGDVIYVADGLYDTTNNGESFPIDFGTNGVSLIGAGGDTSIIDANNAQVNILNIWADDVNISKFELRNAKAKWWASTGNGIYMNDADDCHISNLKIYKMIQGTSKTMEPAGIFMENGSDDNTFSSIEIYDIISNYQPRGIWCYQCSGNQFTDINIHDIDNTGMLVDSCAYGIHLSTGSNGNTLDEITINNISGGEWAEGIELCYGSDSNTFGDLSISDVYADWYAYGILLLDSNDNTFGSSSEIWNIGAAEGDAKGVGLEYTDVTAGSNNNTFESFDVHDTYYGFYIAKSDDNFITKSEIHDNAEGVYLCSAENECVGDALHCNNIYHNMYYGVFKQDPPDVDATGNWWGDGSGPSFSPGNGDKVSGNVLYDPWLLDEFQYCLDCGGIPRSHPTPVPTVNDWGIVAMIAIFGGLLVWTVRRRRLAS